MAQSNKRCMINQAKISEIINKITEGYQPSKVLLFGSYATGNANDNSDLDLIVVKNTNTPKSQRGRELRKLLYGSLVPLDVKIYTPQEFNDEQKIEYSFLNTALKNSKVVYEQQ